MSYQRLTPTEITINEQQPESTPTIDSDSIRAAKYSSQSILLTTNFDKNEQQDRSKNIAPTSRQRSVTWHDQYLIDSSPKHIQSEILPVFSVTNNS